MNTTSSPTTTTRSLIPPARRRFWRHAFIGLVVFSATLAFFYAEENWRGRRAWADYKRQLEAKGIKLDWAKFVPPPVPDDQNVFGVPEMRQWFMDNRQADAAQKLVPPGDTELSKKLAYPRPDTNAARVVVLNLTIGLPGSTPPHDSTVWEWDDVKNARLDPDGLSMRVFGPMAKDSIGFALMAKTKEEIRPVDVFLRCQTAPTAKDLEQLLPKNIIPEKFWDNGREWLGFESTGTNSYHVTMLAPLNAADYVAWAGTVEPTLAIVRQAVSRPYAQMEGDYSDVFGPKPNFVTFRNIVQRLAALSDAYLLLGQPGKALETLTFLNRVRRVLELRPGGRPVTLVSAMINVAITGLYVSTVDDGLRLHAWDDSQLASIQDQLKEINLLFHVADSFSFERIGVVRMVESTSRRDLARKLNLNGGKPDYLGFCLTWLIPQGWIDQNLVVYANLEQAGVDSLDQSRQEIEPHKVDAVLPLIEEMSSHVSPFNLLARVAVPNFFKAIRTMARNQTMVLQGRIACALERYRLAHGGYPDNLDALVPQFIDKVPADLIGGLPPHYHRTDDGKFLLYSLGWSEKDRGGRAETTSHAGDWVWGAN